MIVLPASFLFISAILRLSGGLAYLRAILLNKAKPNPLTWLLWSLTPLISLVVALLVDEKDALLVTAALALSPFLVFVTALIKAPRSLKFDALNLTCTGLALFGLVLWRLSQQANLAILLAILADLVSSLPTLIKAHKHPESEYPPTYILSAVAMILALLTLPRWNFTNAAFLIYVLVLNLIIANLSILGRLKLRR